VRHAGLVFAAVGVAVTGCWAGNGDTAHPHDTLGAITVLARDHDSGEIVAQADLALRGPQPRTLTTSKYGFATFDKLPPGTYDLVATFATQPYEIDGVIVRANQTDYLDVEFTLGRADPIKTKWGDAHEADIERFHPKDMNPTVARIEGTVSDATTHARVAGAVITAQRGTDQANVLQAVSDDQGRYQFEAVTPGTYIVSATYSVGGRGQIEVRRSDIELAGGESVRVPLAVEIAR
jgi:uncharacterized surface anchored protein